MTSLARLRFVWLSGFLFLALTARVARGAKKWVFITAHGAMGSAKENPARKLADLLAASDIGGRVISPEATPLDDLKPPNGPVLDQIRVMREAVLSITPEAEDVVYLGFSMGGKIAGEVTRGLEGRIKRVIMLAPPIRMLPQYLRILADRGLGHIDPKIPKAILIEKLEQVDQRWKSEAESVSNMSRYETLLTWIAEHKYMRDIATLGERRIDHRPTVKTFVGYGAQDKVVALPNLKRFIATHRIASFEAPRLGHDFRAKIEGYPGFESYPDGTATDAAWAELLGASSAFLQE